MLPALVHCLFLTLSLHVTSPPNYVSYVPRSLYMSLPPRALCPMRSRASRAMHLRGLVFHAPRALNVLVPHVPCALVRTLEPRVLALRVFHIS